MSAIAASFSSPFGNSGELGVGITSILGGSASATPNAASIISSGSTETGVLAALSAGATPSAAATATTQALGEGKLTTTQHNVLVALAGGANLTATLPWNTDGSEPTALSQLRQYGWIKLVEPNYNPTTRLTTGAQYTLTEVGKAIYLRTGGSTISSVNVSA